MTPSKATHRKRIATYGKRGALVRVIEVTSAESKRKKYVVQWGPKGARGQESYPGTREGRAEAVAFAEGFSEEMAKKAPDPATPITTRQLWEAYKLDTWPGLRERSKELYTENWRPWEVFYGADRPAGDMRIEDANRFRAALEKAGLATRTIQSYIERVRGVYNFGERAELIQRNRWHQFRFRVQKEKRTNPRAEYKQDEFLAIWRQFDPTDSRRWRAFVAIGLLGLYGKRQTATLHLKWSDLTWSDQAAGAGTLRYAPEYDKVGEEHAVPVLPLTREILAVAWAWRAVLEYTGPYIIPPGQTTSTSDTYTIHALWYALERAEERAGIEKIRFRSGHGFRRGLVGDLLAAGNDMDLALKAIGDRDIRMAKHYAIKRNERIDAALTARAESFDAGMLHPGLARLEEDAIAPVAVPATVPMPVVAADAHATEGATKVQPSPKKTRAGGKTSARPITVSPFTPTTYRDD